MERHCRWINVTCFYIVWLFKLVLKLLIYKYKMCSKEVLLYCQWYNHIERPYSEANSYCRMICIVFTPKLKHFFVLPSDGQVCSDSFWSPFENNLFALSQQMQSYSFILILIIYSWIQYLKYPLYFKYR